MLRTSSVLLISCLSLMAGTRVQDTIYDATGQRANGIVSIEWPAFISTATGRAIPSGRTQVPIIAGILTTELEPTPPGVLYAVRFQLGVGSKRDELWSIPISATPITTATARAGAVVIVLPSSTQLGGDLQGTPGAATVVRIQGKPVVSTQPANLDTLIYNEAEGRWEYGQGSGGGGAGTMGGDISGASSSATVRKVQGQSFAAVSALDGQVWKWNAAAVRWEPGTVVSDPETGGDLDGPASNATVRKIQGVDVDGAAPVDGQMFRYSAETSRWDKVIFIDQEIPEGIVNGVNQVFLLSAPPKPVNSLMMSRNGIVLRNCALGPPCDYNIAGRTVTFIPEAMPQEGDAITVWYRY